MSSGQTPPPYRRWASSLRKRWLIHGPTVEHPRTPPSCRDPRAPVVPLTTARPPATDLPLTVSNGPPRKTVAPSGVGAMPCTMPLRRSVPDGPLVLATQAESTAPVTPLSLTAWPRATPLTLVNWPPAYREPELKPRASTLR